MIRIWSVLMFLLTVVPMALATALLVRCNLRRFRELSPTQRRSSFPTLAICVIAVLFIGLNSHQDNFTGLDVAMYRLMSGAFQEGRGFNDVDQPFEQVPHEVKRSLLYRNVEEPGARQTRDCLFELTDYPNADMEPFFMPTLPLAAAGAGVLGLSRDGFVPLVGALWVLSVFMVSTGRNRKLEWVAAVGLLLGTAWPTWFLRGFHADAVGGILAAMVTLSLFEKRQAASVHLLWGLLLGLSISFHLTMIVIALPVALSLVMRSGRFRDTALLLLGGFVGVLPLLLINAYVCQPYGNFLSFRALVDMYRAVPEIRMVMVGLAVTVACGVMVMTLAHVQKLRSWFETDKNRKLVSLGCIVLGVVPWVLPFLVGGTLQKGLVTTWSGIGLFVIPVMLAATFLFRRRYPLSARVLLACICISALVFLYIKGSEVPVGIWSQRRFCPVVFCLISLLAVPLAEGIGGIAERSLKWGWCVAALIFLPVFVHLFYGYTAYTGSNGSGSERIVEQFESLFDNTKENTLTLFDYYPHSVPYQWNLNRAVFGLNESVGKRLEHEPVMQWLAEEAKTRPVRIICSDFSGTIQPYSYVPPSLVEDGFWLTPKQEVLATSIETIATRAFFPAQRTKKWMVQTVYDAALITETNRSYAIQMKTLDGSPLGLRPPWGKVVKGGMWSREGSGIVGTLPPPGGRMNIEISASWFPPDESWTNQVIVLTPPFKGNPAIFTVGDVRRGVSSLKAVIERAADDVDDGFQTGVYRFHAQTPYDPAAYGTQGFDNDLGVVIESVRIAQGK